MFHGRKEITWVWIGMTWELCLVMTPCSVMTPSTWAWCASLGANRNLNTHVQGVQVSITGTNRQEHTSYPTWTANREHGGSSVRETPCFWKGPLKTETWDNFDLFSVLINVHTMAVMGFRSRTSSGTIKISKHFSRVIIRGLFIYLYQH